VKWGILPDFQAMELPAGWRYMTGKMGRRPFGSKQDPFISALA
jgi:hypothetical protein